MVNRVRVIDLMCKSVNKGFFVNEYPLNSPVENRVYQIVGIKRFGFGESSDSLSTNTHFSIRYLKRPNETMERCLQEIYGDRIATAEEIAWAKESQLTGKVSG